MENALGEPSTILLLGGTSDIGVAIVRAVMSPATRAVVLACREVDAGERTAAGLRRTGLVVEVVRFDALEPETHAALVEGVVSRHGDLDLAIVALGLLGDPGETSSDPRAAFELVRTNAAGAVAATVAVGSVLRRQGHGSIVVLSSVAGERVRRANPVYGGSKAGLDGFAQGFGDLVADDGVHVLVVRPGFVHSSMTAGLPAAPMATSPEAVAAVVAAGLRARRRVVWAPGRLRVVFAVLRHLPGSVWRRLPLG